MKAVSSILFIAIVLCSHLHAEDSLWIFIRIDENLRVSLPKSLQQIDTTLSNKKARLGFRIFKAETRECNLGVTVTPNGTHINVDDEESLKSALDKIAKGACEQATRSGFICRSEDTIIDGLPCKKFEIGRPSVKDIAAYNYAFLVNDRLYTFTVAPLHFGRDKTKLTEESEKFLNSIRFTKTVRERQFASKAESTGYKLGYYLIPSLFAIACIAYIVIRLVKSKNSSRF